MRCWWCWRDWCRLRTGCVSPGPFGPRSRPVKRRSALAAYAAPHGGRWAVKVEGRVSAPVLDGHDARIDQGESGEEPGHLLAGTEGHLLAHRLGQRFFRLCRYIDLIAGRVG